MLARIRTQAWTQAWPWRGAPAHARWRSRRSVSSSSSSSPATFPCVVSRFLLDDPSPLLHAYASTPSLATVQPALDALARHRHTLALVEHYRTKFPHGSPLDNLFFATPHAARSRDSPPSPASPSSPPLFALVYASATRLDDEVLSEAIDTTWRAVRTNVHVHASWRTERNKIRGLGVHTYTLELDVDVPVVVEGGGAGFERIHVDTRTDSGSNPRTPHTHVSMWRAWLGLDDLRDPEHVPLDDADVAWLVATLCTFPSDEAFDVCSDVTWPRTAAAAAS